MKANETPSEPGEDKQPRAPWQRRLRTYIGYALTGLLVFWLYEQFFLTPRLLQTSEIAYSDFKQKLAAGQIVTAEIGESSLTGTMNPPQTSTPTNPVTNTVPFETIFTAGEDPKLVEELQNAGVHYSFQRPANPLSGFLLSLLLPLVLIGGFWYVIARRMGQGTGGGLGSIFNVGKSKATEVKPETMGVTYRDVGGADEAIAELQEIIQFLKTPEQFTALGGHIPKGVLLVGPPGTGKTLLAKATAGEASVPFFETSGSEFIEMFVGVGAARVRDLFVKAHQVAPAIVFIDEIDAIGRSRSGVVSMGGNDEREQTLNQLLAEIDGFKTNAGKPVIIMAATNRPEVLDPALLRAGRFDRQVAVGNPDLTGRLQILKIHSRAVKLAPDFDLERAARMTPGFSGADLANVMNEAALLAARNGAMAVALRDFEEAIERVVAGLEKKSRLMNEQERQTVAYHEAGHALVAALTPNGDPVSKISIIPRSRGALGYTMQMPTEDRYLLTLAELLDKIAVMLGGRAAEMVIFETLSTGASDDILRASELARRMVTEYGMSEQLGSVRYAGQQLQYLDGAVQDNSLISPDTRLVIDREIQRIVTEQYTRAHSLLQAHRTALESLTQQLLKQETVDGSAVKQALAGETQQPKPNGQLPTTLAAGAMVK
jgi:cell division protease FtsH